jgi:hypothetical protein
MGTKHSPIQGILSDELEGFIGPWSELDTRIVSHHEVTDY